MPRIIAHLHCLEFRGTPDVGWNFGFRPGVSSHHADHFMRNAAQNNRLADDRRVAAEGSLPERLAQNRDTRGARTILVMRKAATERERQAKGSEIVAVYQASADWQSLAGSRR